MTYKGAVLMLFLGVTLGTCGALASDDSFSILDRARKLETDGMILLGENFRFEDALVSEDNDRFMVFLSIPHGARVIVDEVSIILDGKVVHRHTYSTSELMLFQSRASQLLYVSRLPPGEHDIRIDVKTMQGKVLPMRAYAFVKERTAKFVDVRLAGAPVRTIEVADW